MFDKISFDLLAGSELLGVYVFFMSIATLLLTISESLLFVFSYPKLIEEFHKNIKGFHKEMKILISRFALLMLFTTTLITIFIFIYFSFQSNDLYVNNLYLLYCLVFFFIIYGFSQCFHFGMYASGQDKKIGLINFSAPLVFIVSMFVIVSINKTLAVPLSLIFAASYILILKSHSYMMLIKRGK